CCRSSEYARSRRLQEGELDRVCPRFVSARDGEVEDIHTIGDGLINASEDAGGHAVTRADAVGDDVGMRRYAGQRPGNVPAVDGDNCVMHVTCGRRCDMASVPVAVDRAVGAVVECVGADELVVADLFVRLRLVLWVAHAEVGLGSEGVLMPVTLAIDLGERRMVRIDPRVENTDDHAFATCCGSTAGLSIPDHWGVDDVLG